MIASNVWFLVQYRVWRQDFALRSICKTKLTRYSPILCDRDVPPALGRPTQTRSGGLHVESSTCCFKNLCHGFCVGRNISNFGVKVSCSAQILLDCSAQGCAHKHQSTKQRVMEMVHFWESPSNRFFPIVFSPCMTNMHLWPTQQCQDTNQRSLEQLLGSAAFPPVLVSRGTEKWWSFVAQAKKAGPSAALTLWNCPAPL